jgi:thiamine pyrophosphokinase
LRAIIFANGVLARPEAVRPILHPDDLLIAADGGSAHYRAIDLTPQVVIGDLDSLEPGELARLEAAGAQVLRYPERKDFTDLELALRYARSAGAEEALVFGALGARWDQTLANLLLPAAAELQGMNIRLVDGPQEIQLLRAGQPFTLHGRPGDTLSLVPLGGDAHGVTTGQLDYPLDAETLQFGATRGISNVFTTATATVRLESGLLLCVVIHQVEE